MYTNDGISLSKKLIQLAYRNRPKDYINQLPEQLRTPEYITVYRATAAPIEKAHNGISWTTDKAIAVWFACRLQPQLQLYQGEIKPKDIVAYCNKRDEREVIQYRKVIRVTSVEVSDSDIADAMIQHQKSCEAAEQRLNAIK